MKNLINYFILFKSAFKNIESRGSYLCSISTAVILTFGVAFGLAATGCGKAKQGVDTPLNGPAISSYSIYLEPNQLENSIYLQFTVEGPKDKGLSLGRLRSPSIDGFTCYWRDLVHSSPLIKKRNCQVLISDLSTSTSERSVQVEFRSFDDQVSHTALKIHVPDSMSQIRNQNVYVDGYNFKGFNLSGFDKIGFNPSIHNMREKYVLCRALNLDPLNTTHEQMMRASRRHLLLIHPDRNGNSKESVLQTQEFLGLRDEYRTAYEEA